jgi:hypothetical protein
MNTTIKSQWIAALRSGDYKQGRGWLRTDNYYCCLGVLCDLHSKANPDHRQSWRPMCNYIDPLEKEYIEYIYAYGKSTTRLLPDDVQRWAGIGCSDPDIVVDNEALILSQLNDRGYTFEQIAKHIEEQL